VDLLTHVLTAYLLTYGIVGFQPSYLAAGALAGGLPDADILFWPLARRWPILRHHGITHSILGVSVVALVGGLLIAPRLAPGSPLVYFLIMWAGGLLHVAEDGFTNFSVPPFLPFSDRQLELDADRAVNLVTLVLSAASFYLLLGVERNRVAFGVYLATLDVLAVVFVAYFAVRLAGRFAAGRRARALGYALPLPTDNPFVWLLLSEEKSGGRMRTRFARYVFGLGVTGGPFSVDVPMEPDGSTGAVASTQEALARSYPIARHRSSLLDGTYHFGEVRPAGPGAWSVTWYSLEMSLAGRAVGVRVDLSQDGRATARRAFYRPSWSRWRPASP
jgi:membrane-bound metal-dependent hydrolase YbcI (DUF457 family)